MPSYFYEVYNRGQQNPRNPVVFFLLLELRPPDLRNCSYESPSEPPLLFRSPYYPEQCLYNLRLFLPLQYLLYYPYQPFKNPPFFIKRLDISFYKALTAFHSLLLFRSAEKFIFQHFPQIYTNNISSTDYLCLTFDIAFFQLLCLSLIEKIFYTTCYNKNNECHIICQ